MAIKNTNTFHYKALKKYTQIGIFGVKIYHLAILVEYPPRSSSSSSLQLSKSEAEILCPRRPQMFWRKNYTDPVSVTFEERRAKSCPTFLFELAD
jgi:REP element-mobilizing transposase RayT